MVSFVAGRAEDKGLALSSRWRPICRNGWQAMACA